MINRTQVTEAVAQAWYTPETECIVMDPILATQIVNNIMKIVDEDKDND